MIPLPAINSDGSYTGPIAGMSIDGDGANGQTDGVPVYGPPGYKPDPLDYLANAGHPGNWFGVVTDAYGKPVIQGESDPAPGAYVSATSYMYPGHDTDDPRAYVDAASVPYIVLPGHWRKEAKGIVLGCKGIVHDTKTGIDHLGVTADFGPKNHFFEASIAMAKLCGVPHSPKNGGTDQKRFIVTFFPGVQVTINGVTYELKKM